MNMAGTDPSGPADLGERAMPESEHRDPPTRHGETVTPGDAVDESADSEEGIGDKVKDAVGGVIGKAKGMLNRND
jgi:hypothetical protein